MTEVEHTTPDGRIVRIRPLAGPDEYRACVELQHDTWGANFSENVPLAILMVSQRLGGVTAGAFDEAGNLVAFVFGLTGLEEGSPVHWSDMLAVRPAYRNAGLGLALKAYQRDRMLSLGIQRMYWTFDPLQSKNAWLNFGRLGAVSSEYISDMYGRSDSPLHAGIGTDRFVVRWELGSERVQDRLAGRRLAPDPSDLKLPEALAAESVAGPWPSPGAEWLDLTGRRVAVSLPADIDALKADDMALAVQWRSATRRVITAYLARRYEARELLRGGAVSRYVLHALDKDD